MCGIVGIARSIASPLTIDDRAVARMRDTMTHRGPDGAGLWRSPHVVLAHRRLAVIDPTPAGQQPFLDPVSGSAIVYNGELYNDADLRRELSSLGVRFHTASDTETVLQALLQWGRAALPRLRGMFALAFFDARARTVLLARDPLGIKPLYVLRRRGGVIVGSTPWGLRTDGDESCDEILFASEPQAILAHPEVPARPNLDAIVAYMTTIRVAFAEQSLFEGISAIAPGASVEFSLERGEITAHPAQAVFARRGATERGTASFNGSDITRAVRDEVEDSIARHLRSDVPLCSLLSGGLDSSIIALVARRHLSGLTTYCSGAVTDDPNSDFRFARLMAAQLGTRHVEAPVTRSMFIERWPEMVAQQGIPLSTPNEVAINEVARRLRADGMVVALSGEGADELFGGYEIPLSQARQFESARATIPTTSAERARFQLLGNAWIPPETWTAILTPDALAAVSGESLLFDRATGIFSEIADDRDAGEGTSVDAAMQSHLRFQRRVNLTGLLGRLDTATMLASVEGRTPLADARIASLAECLPMASKYVPAGDTHPARTKIALRDAFADVLPAAIVDRPKASFPLPFQTWIGDVAPVLRESSLAREIFTEAAIETVAARTGELWTLAWPMVNIALWGKRWWG